MYINCFNRLPSMTPVANKVLVLERYNYNDHCTLGSIFDNDKCVCFTLEPPPNCVFPCIDTGTYIIDFNSKSPTFSHRFPYKSINNGFVPLVEPTEPHKRKRSGIRIHIGNTAADTKGCILLGESCEGIQLYKSAIAYKNFVETYLKYKYLFLKIVDVL